MWSPCTARRSSGSRAAAASSTSPAHSSDTANGCAARTGASTPVSNCEPPTKCSAVWGPKDLRERAQRELLATGESARRRADDARGVLTPRRHTSPGLPKTVSPTQRSAHNYSSAPRTVQYHLRKVFAKLDITSRNQLSRVPASQLSAAH